MKVLIDGHMIGQNEGGNERYTKNLAYALSERSNVGVLLSRKHKIPSSITPHIVPHNNLLRLLLTPFLIWVFHYDVYHANYFLPFWKPPHTKYVITVHDLFFLRQPTLYSLRDRIVFRLLLPHSLRLCDAIIVPSIFIKNEFAKLYPSYLHKVYVTYEGVDPVFHHLKNRKKGKPPFFLTIASKNSRKNIDMVCSAFLNAGMKNTCLYIVGSLPPGMKHASERSIRFLGYVSDQKLNKLYNEAEALLYLSSYEGFGLPVIEALACGTPVIASDIPCLREIGESHIQYIKPRNLIDTLIHHHKRVVVKKLYTWKDSAQKTLAVYRSLMG